jgi:hypothetical protein
LNITKASLLRKGLIVATAALGMLAGTIGPAGAAGAGLGTLVGHEHAPDSELLSTGLLCARYIPSGQYGPLKEHLYTEGTYSTGTGGVAYVGTATADFTSTSADYYANPLGTYSDAACSTAYAVPGTMEIHEHIGVGTVDCSGSATYQRQLTSVFTIVFTGSCTVTDALSRTGTVSTTVTFVGAVEPCLPFSCPAVVHPESLSVESAEALLEGAYLQT